MSFWAYMLHCRGGFYYTGHTDDLERRIAEHQSGTVGGFTADYLPAELAWSQEFVTHEEAKAAEKQIKGWSRAKKMALIRGNWDRVSKFARKKDDPSTGSGRTGKGRHTIQEPAPPKGRHPPQKPVYPELVEGSSFTLVPHSDRAPTSIKRVTARIGIVNPHWLKLRWRIEGGGRLIIPPFAGKSRADNLWQTTCFELFLRRPGECEYAEINLSPSERWAAYDFADYRADMTERAMPRDPVCTIRGSQDLAIFDAAIPLARLPALPWEFGLSAVLKEEGGTKSYWALAHPPGKPDFHHADCFAATLAAPDGS